MSNNSCLTIYKNGLDFLGIKYPVPIIKIWSTVIVNYLDQMRKQTKKEVS